MRYVTRVFIAIQVTSRAKCPKKDSDWTTIVEYPEGMDNDGTATDENLVDRDAALTGFLLEQLLGDDAPH